MTADEYPQRLPDGSLPTDGVVHLVADDAQPWAPMAGARILGPPRTVPGTVPICYLRLERMARPSGGESPGPT
ncbi:hypothetical protein OG894_44505 (plasmid) [Streptomyces sp. NBC_01724]|uniref:hypothetical protein n=1 Tax=Streptomyces sp. NBC_01724 TaxID=2975922 RepID=UPI002E35F9D9|nr:hypothetical protein [Streptomyces sp. NBC_01724]